MKALFVGLGSIGQRHLRNLIRLHPEVECAAVRSGCSASPVLDESNNPQYDLTISEHYQIKEYKELTDGLQDFVPDLVFITNPSSLHFEIAKEALKHGPYIFIEKPFATSLQQAEELIYLESKTSQKRIMVGFQYRFHPALEWASAKIKNGSLGNIISSKFINSEYMPGWHPYEDYRESYAAKKDLGGGALLTQIHDFDCVINLFGMPYSIFCVGGKLSRLEINVEDSIQMLMESKCANGIFPTTISLDYLRYPPKREFEIIGEYGTLHCNLNTSICIHSDVQKKESFEVNFNEINRNDLFIKELNSFINFAMGRSMPIVDLETAFKSLKLCMAAKQSMEKKVLITL